MLRTVFDRHSGFANVSRTAVDFYDKVLDSPAANPYFVDVDMRRLIDHQTRFIASVMGGPASYTNDHLERVHARLGITEEAFTEVLMLLTETLEDFDFQDDDIRHVEAEIMSRKNFILARN